MVPAPDVVRGSRGHFPLAVGAGGRGFWRQLEPASLAAGSPATLGNVLAYGDVLGVAEGLVLDKHLLKAWSRVSRQKQVKINKVIFR